MRSRLTLAVAWLALSGMAAPGAPIADEPGAPADVPGQQATVPAPPAEVPPVAPGPPPPPPAPTPSGTSQTAATPSPAAPPPTPVTPAAPVEDAAPDRKPERPVAFAATPGSVTIQDFSFGPGTVTVDVGETVTWRNSGPSSHTATATGGSFDTGLLARGESSSVTFDEAGTFSYICTPHPSMKGTVRVVAQASGDDTSAGDGTSGAGGTADADGSSTASGPESSGERLPETGADPLWIAVTGIGLLLIGGSGMRLSGRRGRVTQL